MAQNLKNKLRKELSLNDKDYMEIIENESNWIWKRNWKSWKSMKGVINKFIEATSDNHVSVKSIRRSQNK